MVTTGILLLCCLGLFKLDPSGLSTEEQYTKEFDSIKGQTLLIDHGLEDNSNTVQIVTNTDALPEVEEAIGEVDGLGEPDAATGHRQWSVLLRGHDRGGRLIDRCVRHRREHPRCGP